MELISIVVFVRTDISNIHSDKVYDTDELRKIINPNDEQSIDEIEINRIFNLLMYLKVKCPISKEEHVRNIKTAKQDIENGICPRCGGKLVLRTSKDTGNKFWGCENIPKCRFIKKP